MKTPTASVAYESNAVRPDIEPKVSGRAKYASDRFPKNVLYAQYIRFPYGKGKITSADVKAAETIPGIVEVEVNTDKEANYPGDRMGHVAGDSLQAVKDAIAALNLNFSHEEAKTQGAKYYDGPPDLDAEQEQRVQLALEQAEASVEATYDTQVQTHSCLETHGCLVEVKEDSAQAWASTQSLQSWEEGLAKAAGVPRANVVVDATYVGGGFGSKFGLSAEGNLATRLAKKHGRPCRVFFNRSEEHQDAGNRPGSFQYMHLGVRKDGKITGGRIHVVSTVGYTGGRGGVVNPRYYDFGDIVRTEDEIALNSGLPRAFRAPGYPQGCFALESMMDELAAKLGMDPIEFRKVNETSERRKKQMDMGVGLIGWSNRRPDGSGSGIMRTGYGMGVSTWGNSPGSAEADVDIYPNGEVEVRCGVQDIGTGTSAVVTDVVAGHLGLGRDWVTGKCGISTYPPGPASGGSFVSRTIAPALIAAAEDAIAKLKKQVAREAGASDQDVRYDKGTFSLPGGESMIWADACQLISDKKIAGHGSFDEKYFGEGTSDCVQFAQVEVDTETGIVRVKKIVAIHAMGKPANRITAENQIYGGVIQGVSYALLENRILDRMTGSQLNDGFIDYKIAGSLDVPEIIPVIDADERDTGVRALGEPVTIPTSAAIANAVANAIGARVRALPILPDKVLAALDEQGGQA